MNKCYCAAVAIGTMSHNNCRVSLVVAVFLENSGAMGMNVTSMIEEARVLEISLRIFVDYTCVS